MRIKYTVYLDEQTIADLNALVDRLYEPRYTVADVIRSAIATELRKYRMRGTTLAR